jgi:hypothetical protein
MKYNSESTRRRRIKSWKKKVNLKKDTIKRYGSIQVNL